MTEKKEVVPTPVAVVNAPVDVEVVGLSPAIEKKLVDGTAPKGPTGLRLQNQASDPSVPATTTFQQDLTKAGQRHINVIWERTQQAIAITVTLVVSFCCVFLIWRGEDATEVPAFLLLSNVFFLVVGTYFQRTNHTKTGGVAGGSITR